MHKNLVPLTAVIGACLLGGIPTANATATLRLTSSDATQVTVGDGSALDGSGATGSVIYNGGVGANWVVNVTTGLTYPVSGYTTANGHLDLNSVDVSAGAGSLILEFSQVGFDSLSLVESWGHRFGGTMAAGASASFKVYAGSGLFDHGTLISDSGILTGTPFLNTGSGIFGPSASHSLTLEVVLNHRQGGTTSFDAEAAKVPESGSSVAAICVAMVGLGLIRRKLAKA